MKKLELPTVEYEKSTKKQKVGAVILILANFILPFIIAIIAGIVIAVFAPNTLLMDTGVILGIQIIFDVVMIIWSLLYFRKKLNRDWKIFKENSKKYLKYTLIMTAIMLVLSLIASLIVFAITGKEDTENQLALESFPMWYLIPGAIIVAPILEEIIFRGAIRRLIKNKTLFIIISALIFGLMHSIAESTLSNVIIMGIPYMVLGGTFAHIYAKTDNIINCILSHSLNNLIALIMVALQI